MGLLQFEDYLGSWGKGDVRRGEAKLCGRKVGEGETLRTEEDRAWVGPRAGQWQSVSGAVAGEGGSRSGRGTDFSVPPFPCMVALKQGRTWLGGSLQ